MKILISNDDGIFANGIKVLSETLSKIHDIYIVAPDHERSAASHSITLYSPLRIKEHTGLYGSVNAWATTGTPGDCVKIGLTTLIPKEDYPDFVISGINHGPNLGHDIIYSGTVSCAVEGAMFHIPSIAVSLHKDSLTEKDFQPVADYILSLLDKIIDYRLPLRTMLNINFPNCEKEDIKGVAITKMGSFMYTDKYEKRIDPRGNAYYWQAGTISQEAEGETTDITAIRQNKISITPLSFNLTKKEAIKGLENLLCQ